MSVDLIHNGQGQGPVAQEVLAAGGRLNAGAMKPFIAEDGKSYISVFKGGDPKKPENYSVHLTTGILNKQRISHVENAIGFEIESFSVGDSFKSYAGRREGLIVSPVTWTSY